MPPQDASFRLAVPSDAARVVPLVNGAYRGDASGRGWTTEADLVAGARIDEAGFKRLLERPDSVVLVAERAGRVVGCVHLQRGAHGECHLGLLSVLVAEQASGLGRAILAVAEAHARDQMAARRMVMDVVSERHELLAWYERRGYRRTGQRIPFAPGEGQRFLRGPLAFERLEKGLL